MSVSIDFGKEFLEKALRRGVDEAVVRVQERLYELIVFDGGVLRSYGVSRVVGVGVQVVVKGFVGYSYTSSLSMEAVEEAIDRAVKLAKAMASTGKGSAFAPVNGVKTVYRTSYSINPLDVDPSEKVSLVAELNRLSLGVQGIVSAVTRFGAEIDRRVVVSSYGAEAFEEIVGAGVSHLAVARFGEVMERVQDQRSFIAGYEAIKSFDWQTFVKEVSELAVKASQARVPKPGAYRAVIDNELIGLMLHEAFGHASEGDLVMHRESVLYGKLGTKIASELVTIVDDGLAEGGYPAPFDDEGVAKKRTVVVEKGTLRGYLTHRQAAHELGTEVSGNGRAQDITFMPIVRQTNFFMLPGDARIEELFEGVSEGIHLKGRGAMGGQVNTAVGTFTFSVGPSYIIRNGEPAELVRGVVVSGNILETLMNVEAVARDLKVTTSVFGGCGKDGQLARVGDGGPHARVSRIVVGGG
jgi:TldD protein